MRSSEKRRKKRYGNRFPVTIILTMILLEAAVVTRTPFAADYQAGTIAVTTFNQEAVVNGTNILLLPADTITLGGGSLSVSGEGTEYSALIGTGPEIQTGFSWGTGGTINLGEKVTLSINVPSSAAIPLTQTGTGTLNLTDSGTQNLVLTQTSGTMNVAGNLTTSGNSVIIRGALNVAGEYSDYARQTTVYGSVLAQSVNFVSGGLDIESSGEFIVTGRAVFTEETAIRNLGVLDVGDNSELESTTIADSGTFRMGTGTAITSIIGNSGNIIAEGTVSFSHVTNFGTIEAAGDASFGGELDAYSGSITLSQSGTFGNISDIMGGSTLDVQGTADFQDELNISENAKVTVGGNLTSSSDITVTNGTLSSGGNITTTQGLSVTGTSILGLSNRLQGAELGNLEAGTSINLASSTQIETDFSGLTSYKAPVLLVHMTAGSTTDDFMIDSAPTNVDVVGSLFGTSTLLRQIYAVDNGSGYDIYGRVRSLGEYAQSEGLEPPAIEAGNAVDNMLGNITPSNPAYGMAEDLLNQTDPGAVNQTLYNLATGYGVENVFAMTLVNLGQAGSPFFQGSAAGLPMKTNHCHIPEYGRNEYSGRLEAWGAPFYQSLDAGGSAWQPGFNMHRTGFMFGVRKRDLSRSTGGILFAYSAPRLNQSGSLSGYNANFRSRLELDDWQLAAHWEYETDNHLRFFLFAGGGSQNLDVHRNARGTASTATEEISMNRSFNGSTDGNSLSVTAYVERPFCYGNGFALTPVAGIDCMYAWLYSFGENSTGTGAWQDMTNLSEGNFYSPVQYSRTEYHRIMARAGLKGEYNWLYGGVSMQAFYGTQLGGEDHAIMSVSTLDGALNNRLYGLGLGNDSLNLGAGLWRYLTPSRYMAASIHYNYFTLSQSDVSNITAAFMWRF